MLTAMRHKVIMNLLVNMGTVSVEEICSSTGCSPATARRDLNALALEGKLVRVHGGATIAGNSGEIVNEEEAVSSKSTANVREKIKIAGYAAKLIRDDDFIFLDAGTTTEHLVNVIENSKATFVTNGVSHATSLIRKGIKTYVVGGEVKLSTEAIAGSLARDFLKQFNFTKAFIGTNGFSENNGFTTPDPNEALIKSLAIEKSAVSYVLADSSKFNRVYPIEFAPANRCIIITDKMDNRTFLDVANVRIAE